MLIFTDAFYVTQVTFKSLELPNIFSPFLLCWLQTQLAGREKLGSSLTLCSAASTLLCSVGSCSSAGCIVGKSWQEAIAQVWALAAAYPHPHYTAFLHFPLRASNSPLPFRPPSKYLIHFLGSMEVLHICDFSIPLQSFVSKQQPNRIKGNSAH